MNTKVSAKNIISMTGLFCAYYFGAAFASGREMMQFFSGFGISGFLGLIPVAVLYTVMGMIITEGSYKEQFLDPYDFFPYSCGRKLGAVFVWILTVLLAGDMMMMTASAGANLNENIDMPLFAGRCIVFVSAATVCLGLERIVDIVSKLGPFVAIFIGVVSIIAIVKCQTTMAEGNAAIPSLDIYTGNNNIAISSFKYTMYNVLTILPVLVVSGGKSNSIRESRIISITQVAALIFVCILVIISQIKNIQEIYYLQIPSLMIIHIYMPVIQNIFSIILLICTYSSTTVMMWALVRKFTEEGRPSYYILTIGISIVIFIGSGLFTFSQILDYITSIGMYAGVLFFIVTVVNTVRRKTGRI